MKIAVLAYSSLPRDVGGAQVFTYNLIRHLLRRSHQVDLYLPRKYVRQIEGRFPSEGGRLRIIPIAVLEYGLARYLPFVIHLILLFRQLLNRYDVWQVIGAYPAAYVAKGLASRVPVVLRSYGVDIQKDPAIGYGLRLDPLLERRIRETVRTMTRLVALTPTVRDCYLELGAPAGRIDVISNAIDVSRFRGPSDREGVRRRYGIREGQTFILSTGRYHLKKGYEYIIPAAVALKAKGRDFRWLIVGKDVRSLSAKVREAGLEDAICLVEEIGMESGGAVEDMASMPPRGLIELYRAADLYVLPSLLETFGMVLIEAMAAELPVVTTDAPGCRDVVEEGVDGLKARAADAASLAACIGRVLEDGGLQARLRENALASAHRYDWERVVARYEGLYAEAAKGT